MVLNKSIKNEITIKEFDVVILSEYECGKITGGGVIAKALYNIGYFIGGISRGLSNYEAPSTGGATRFGE